MICRGIESSTSHCTFFIFGGKHEKSLAENFGKNEKRPYREDVETISNERGMSYYEVMKILSKEIDWNWIFNKKIQENTWLNLW